MSNNIGMSILVPFLLGVASLRHVSSYDNRTVAEPIAVVPKSICAELCRAGLGGKPCGDGCSIPSDLEAAGTAAQYGLNQQQDYTRKDVCPVLCANFLGDPLCTCTYPAPHGRFATVNFIEICAFYCDTYNYRISGCDDCEALANMTRIRQDTVARRAFGLGTSKRSGPNWNKWCIEMCHEGDGGAACNCDILPMMLEVK